jgi:hypothetical protein
VNPVKRGSVSVAAPFAAWLVVCAFSPAGVAEAEDLSDKGVVREYEAAGLALRGTLFVPTDSPHSIAVVIGSDRPAARSRFEETRREIIGRGSRIVPELLEFLRREVPRKRPKDASGLVPGFTRDVIEMLITIGDPGAAGALLDILDGYRGKATPAQRHAALSGLERLTYCAFRKVKLRRGDYRNTVVHPTAVEDDEGFRTNAAAMYGTWLEGEGKVPANWLPLARERARRILASDDLAGIYCVATFLRPYRGRLRTMQPTGRDDRPEKTLARLAELVGEFKKTTRGYVWKTVNVPCGNWMHLIAGYGPMARPYARVLIRLHEESGLDDWGGFEKLRRVGGQEIMVYLFQCLPRVSKDPLWHCRCNIDRWAGRWFANDKGRLEWWKANKHKSQEDWLREGLPIVAAQADAGELHAHWIIESMLPGLPPPYRTRPSAGLVIGESIKLASRVSWLVENKARLEYDPQLGGFRLRKD